MVRLLLSEATTALVLFLVIAAGCDDQKKKTTSDEPGLSESEQRYQNTYGPDGVFGDIDLTVGDYAPEVSNCNDGAPSYASTVAEAISYNFLEDSRPHENWYLRGDMLFAFINNWEQWDDSEGAWVTGMFLFDLVSGQVRAFYVGADAEIYLSESGWLWTDTRFNEEHHGIFEPPNYTEILPEEWAWISILVQEGIIDSSARELTPTKDPHMIGDRAVLNSCTQGSTSATLYCDYYAYDTNSEELQVSANTMGEKLEIPHFPREYDLDTVFYAPQIDSYMKIRKPQYHPELFEVVQLDQWDFQPLSDSTVSGNLSAEECPWFLTLSHDLETGLYWDATSKTIGIIDIPDATASELQLSNETVPAKKSLISNGENLQFYDRTSTEYHQYDLSSPGAYEVGPCKWSAVDDDKAVCIDLENKRLLIHEFSWNTNTFHALDYSCNQ